MKYVCDVCGWEYDEEQGYPEGGIAPEEAEWLVREAGAKLVTLGSRILRTETAAIASQTIVMALRGEME